MTIRQTNDFSLKNVYLFVCLFVLWPGSFEAQHVLVFCPLGEAQVAAAANTERRDQNGGPAMLPLHIVSQVGQNSFFCRVIYIMVLFPGRGPGNEYAYSCGGMGCVSS